MLLFKRGAREQPSPYQSLSFNPKLADSTYNFTSQTHKFGTVFVPNHIKIDMQAHSANYMENLW